MRGELILLRDHLLQGEADFLWSFLAAEGVESFLFGLGTIGAQIDPAGEIRLLVHSLQLEKAREILRVYEEDGPREWEE